MCADVILDNKVCSSTVKLLVFFLIKCLNVTFEGSLQKKHVLFYILYESESFFYSPKLQNFQKLQFRLPLIKSTTLFWSMINLKDKIAIDLCSVPLCFLPLVSVKASIFIHLHFIKVSIKSHSCVTAVSARTRFENRCQRE